MKQIPNFFTLLNLVFGSMAVVCILQTSQQIVFIENEGFSSWVLPENMALGSIFILLAAVVDFLDGFVARLFKATSAMGAQLDSLADMVSFGLAPGLIFYQLLRISFAKEEGGLDVSTIWLLPAVIYICAVAWRLAKFNIDSSQAFAFKGLPSPAAGLFVASFPLIVHYRQWGLETFFTHTWVLYSIILLLSYLLVCNIPMLSLKFKDYTLKNNIPKIILLGIGIASASIFHWLALPIVILLYVMLSLLFKTKNA